jgi:rRNA-processing protein FCF1
MIILDTDFLITSIKYKVDVVAQIKANYPNEEIAIMDKTLDELKNVNIPNARAAAHLVKLKEITIIKTKKDKIVDKLILEKVEKDDIIATQDRDLKRKLKKKDIKVITIRQKKYVSI